MKTYEILESAALILHLVGWTQGALARNKNGESVDVYPENPLLDAPPACFCAIGAMIYVREMKKSYARSATYQIALMELDRAARFSGDICSVTGVGGLATYNDVPGRTKEEVLELMLNTATSLRAAELPYRGTIV